MPSVARRHWGRKEVALGTILAFDLGGTTLRAQLFDVETGRGGTVAREPSGPVRERGGQPVDALVDVLVALTGAAAGWDAAIVVLAVPGPLSGGRAWSLPTLFGREFRGSVDFDDVARRVWPGRRVLICNDLTAAGYRYVAEGLRDFLVLTVGSGIGSKLFLDGRPLLGFRGFGGEIGHWRVPGGTPLPCDCGGEGHLGALASGRGCLNLARQTAGRLPAAFARSALSGLCGGDPAALTTAMLAEALRAGDGWTVDTVAVAADALGAALAIAHLLTGIDRVVLTGGFATACGEPLRQLIRRAAAASAWPTGLDWDQAVRLADRDDEPGLGGGCAYGQLVLGGMPPCG